MSKFSGLLSILFWAFLSVVFPIDRCIAQDAAVSVSIQPGDPSLAVVEGKFEGVGDNRELRFLTQFGQISNLDQRVSNIELANRRGEKVTFHAVGPGRFIADANFNVWRYRVDISASEDRFALAHLSWANDDGAMIALQDLLPQGLRSARATIIIPTAWTVLYDQASSSNGVFELNDVERAVFHAGRSLRTETIRPSGAEIKIMLSGEFRFTDNEAAKMADSIFTAYTHLFGSVPARNVQIAIRAFPTAVPPGQWEAGSRGSAITIVSSDMPFKSQSLQRLHEQLRHEIFHLWVPNALNLTGNYDWFYEGFALYNSLKTGVAVNRIRFDDFLDTLSRAYSISTSQAHKYALMKESENRWSGSNTSVYARGMLAAFACDIALLNASKGKRSISEILKKVFVENRGAGPRNANEAILAVLNSYKELKPIVDRSITGSGLIDWDSMLQGAGLEFDTREQKRIKVANNLSGRQKEVLDRLGYNNWRRLPRVDK